MTRLLIHVEGETEESFVNELVAPHLYGQGLFTHVSARLIGNARQRERRGGIRAWQAVKRDIIRHLRQDGGAASSTFVDFYALPATGQGAWPGREQAIDAPFSTKSALVEQALLADIEADLGGTPINGRFIPFVVMHEFEGLLFSSPADFCRGISRPDLEVQIQGIRDQFGSPEEINDSPQTAPSKRIEALVPGYQKPLYGTLAALEIGLMPMRAACPLFDRWMARLEAWGRERR
ncbi:DUF4276 family protein [Roseateles sp. MS654]|uniref:DUF4276 family protein n=1 Tax=Roseateles sp. MS654 TaxID=3412685 RepID=UPI003C2EE3DC